MIRKIILGFLVVVFAGQVHSQVQNLTLEDAIVGRYTKFRAKSPSQLGWIPNESSIYWVTKDTANPKMVKQAVDGKEAVEVCSLDDLKKYDALTELKRFPRVKWISDKTFRFKSKQTVYKVDVSDKMPVVLFDMPKGANADWANENTIAYTRDNNLYIWANNKEIQVTDDTLDGLVHGQSVHRFEFGIHKGTFWSNNASLLAFYSKDETMVTKYPLTNFTTKPASLNSVRYPMAGMTSHEVRVGIYDVKNSRKQYLDIEGPKDQYLTNIAWGPEDKFIYIAVLNRDQNHVKLNQYDVSTGKLVKTILEEKHANYVQPLHAMEFIPDQDDKFIWQSEKDGYNHIYTYNLKGKMLKQVTQGEWVVTGTHGFDSEGNVIVTRADNRGMDRVCYKYNPMNGKSTSLGSVSGVHYIAPSTSGQYFIDRYTNISSPLTINLIDSKGAVLREISNAKNTLEGYDVSMPELGVIKTNEGIELNTRVFKPFDFDPNKKYKALVYVYNGPGVQLITNSWMAGAPLWMPYFANKGYIIFTVDGRGSENRGREFEQAVFRRLGELELVDQLSGLEYLRGLDYVNPDKVAVYGWSYGGFMTTSLMLKAPGLFQVGVAGGPVIDWKYYEVMYTERYMDTPETNEAGYARASLLDKVQNLKGDLLIIHGADDDVVVPQHSIDFLKQSVDKGVQVDFFIYPDHKHNVRGKDRIHLMRKVLDYIDEKME
ncbi:MAG: hypothetical protein CL840_19595 [Crocinitomicaceae bacterium]|nr:hypothetical protein [Crocinitomicaceae bacterium]|tara:strand:- start:9748 stop:11883 length:2136 start_codon:yes stop_codon:yes gene_type:complete